MMNKIYPHKGDKQTVYMNTVIKDQSTIVGDYTIYNDFVSAPIHFEENNILYHHPINSERLIIGNFHSIAYGTKFLFSCANHTLKSLSTYTFPLFYDEWKFKKSDVAKAWDNKGDITKEMTYELAMKPSSWLASTLATAQLSRLMQSLQKMWLHIQ